MRHFVSLLVAAGVYGQAFPDSQGPPVGWTGPVFKLSQSYPATPVTTEPKPWKSFDFKTQPAQYIKAVLDYCLEGNLGIEFRVQDNAVRKWFHAPWMHAQREFMRGLTKERRADGGDIHPNQTTAVDNWGVGFYNPVGGQVLGRVWRDPEQADPAAARFPDGTVSFKLLFTTATVAQVPFLAGTVEWNADINHASGLGPRPTVRLLQIDIAVRDTRANATTGWVFGTFIYNGNASGATPWAKMVPVGLMWGNDPTKVGTTTPLAETWINPDVLSGTVPLMQHLGFEKRLNGPVDNPRSSCLSCHSTAGIPSTFTRRPIAPVPRNNASIDVLRRYFRNIKSGRPFDNGYLSLDYSLQLQRGIFASLPSGSRQ